LRPSGGDASASAGGSAAKRHLRKLGDPTTRAAGRFRGYGMSETQPKVTSLSEFMKRVAELRDQWQLPFLKEPWFRDESREHETRLRPELYRPQKGKQLKLTDDLLKIENELYKDFQRCGHGPRGTLCARTHRGSACLCAAARQWTGQTVRRRRVSR
jgi:hypothetical protein